MDKKTIRVKEVLEDIRAGTPDRALREKYKLSEKGLDSLLNKLVAAGVLTQAELEERTAGAPGTLHMAWKCPACGFAQTREYNECPECGVIVKKFHATRARESGTAGHPSGAAPQTESVFQDTSTASRDGGMASPEHALVPPIPDFNHDQAGYADETSDELTDVAPETLRMGKTEWLLILVCPAVALICFAVFWFRWTLETFKTLVHEMGHAIFGWIFGYPSFPAFDFMWGGGVTLHTARSTALLVLIYFGFAGLIWLYRKNQATMALLIATAILHALFSFTSVHSILILFMGHGTELIIAGLFIYRSLTGRAVFHSFERPLYGIIGFFIVFADLALAYRLLTSASYRAEYASAKGGDIDMDFVRIAGDYLHTTMTPVVVVFLACCLLCLVLSFLAFRYMEYIHAFVARLWTREPEGHAGYIGK
ncbi:MAG: hypothetical protein HY913_00220 [Desulfomonile tiedjei]|nr:hypothetical protein [Desulfomonile tiedjei]